MEKKLVHIKFLIVGITCTGCAMDMENILLGMDGVEDASINFKDGVFSITYNPDEIKEKTITKKVKNLGFESKLLTD